MDHMIFRATLTRNAEKQLRKVPRHVMVKLKAWVVIVEKQGLEEARRIPGFHDEPLSGSLYGKRSIRLSKAYRAIYEIQNDASGALASIKEVTNHEY